VEDEAALRLDRPAEMDWHVRRFPGFDLELLQQCMKANVGDCRADANAKRTFIVMRAHSDNRTLETRIAHTRQCKQELARVKERFVHSQILFRRAVFVVFFSIAIPFILAVLLARFPAAAFFLFPNLASAIAVCLILTGRRPIGCLTDDPHRRGDNGRCRAGNTPAQQEGNKGNKQDTHERLH
jgi:hypothetical protein